jgi:GT2 family glycosyltransferase
MELSVIIVSYNVRYFLEQCLLSVRKASENIDCEVFVVDNNSTDGSCSMVKGEFPEVKLIMNNANRGFSAANNQALEQASGRFFLLLNPDTIVEENTFKSCISFMDSHPDAGQPVSG